MTTTKQNIEFTQNLLPSYPLDDSIEWIRKNLEPLDVFDDEQLEQWAEEHGFVKG